jgi:signal peptidase II
MPAVEPASATSAHGLSRLGWLPVAVLVVVVDRITKAWAVHRLSGGRTIDLVWTLRFNLTYNTGMSFGTGQGWGPIIGVVAMVVVVVLLLGLQRGGGVLATVSVGAIVGGAVGNLLDRLFRDPYWLRGGVVDFIDLQWFPIFNVADMGITLGGIGLLVSAWLTARAAAGGTEASSVAG